MIKSLKRDMPPVHPGEILREEFLKPMNITQYRLAKCIGVPQRRIGEIVAGKRAVTADTALRFARFFGTDAQSWMNLQTHYDLLNVEQNIADRLDREILTLAEHLTGQTHPSEQGAFKGTQRSSH